MHIEPSVIVHPHGLDFAKAAERLRHVVAKTPLQYNERLSRKHGCHVYLKREDLQVVRSYKIRGAYNMTASMPREVRERGLVCASAGNHAQGFAYSCRLLETKGVVFMPVITPRQKIGQTRMFGEEWVEIRLAGDTFDDCAEEARRFTEERGMSFVPPFDDARIVEGQGTVGMEILEELKGLDFLFLPVGGGGLSAGTGAYVKSHSPETRIIGLEPEGAPSMSEAFKAGKPVRLETIDPFVDGAAVRQVGDLTYSICSRVLDEMHLVPEGRVCSTILRLYNEEAVVVEPAGALAVAALDDFTGRIRGKTVVCVVSGSNNDIERMPEIRERSLQHEGLKHYFLVSFAQRPGALREFVNGILGPTDDITRFEYMQKTNKEAGPALVGVELQARGDYRSLVGRMDEAGIRYTEINKDDKLFGYLV